MKSIKILLVLFISLFLSKVTFAQKATIQTDTLTVYGNCTQCKDRIEEACDQKGIKEALWNVDTKILTVVYNPAKISLEQIHEFIAVSGHDTNLKKADDSVYDKLPGCCLYREHPNTHHD
ncbi:MAG: cation-transporting ATPase [Bacteroidia bacterium]|nr:cation-transporting ATPase [Bacteroidia bacterium]MCF8425877.1 cation-transporting ATPase [Bacteroidia bacterium]MCF8445656.1 cation-transporting ATPase [Bacteroidia bacterium]